MKNNFDLLRLFASLSVLLTHSIVHLYQNFGYSPSIVIKFIHKTISFFPAVPIFFLISGYLISMSYERNSNLKIYILNRVLRIYPALIINIIVGILILYYFGFIKFNGEFFKWLLAQLSIVQFYNADMFRGFGVGVINGSLWTISVELTFYILLPILLYYNRKNILLIWVLFIVSYALWIYDRSSNKEIFINKLLHTTIVPYLFLFIVGIWFYQYDNKLKRYFKDKFLIWLVAFSFFHFIILFFDLKMNIFLYTIQWFIFIFLIFSFAFSYQELSQKLLKGNDYTYGIYIYHMLIINVFVHLKLVGNNEYFSIVILLSVVAGIVSWYFVEKPFLQLKKHSLFQKKNINYS